MSEKINKKLKELFELIRPKIQEELTTENQEINKQELASEKEPKPVVEEIEEPSTEQPSTEQPSTEQPSIDVILEKIITMINEMNKRIDAIEQKINEMVDFSDEIKNLSKQNEELSKENEKLAKKNINFNSIVNTRKSDYYDEIKKKLGYIN